MTRDGLLEAAGEAVFRRGDEYHSLGQVLSLAEYGGTVTAVVHGARRYRVTLRRNGSDIVYDCNCPAGDGGRCCKHCVAAGLAYLDRQSRAEVNGEVSLDDVEIWLGSQRPERLVELLMAEALGNEGLREKMLIEAAAGGGKRIGLDGYHRAVDLVLSKALWNGGSETGQEHLAELKASLNRLLSAGRRDEFREVADYALSLLASTNSGTRPTPESMERLREFAGWLKGLIG